MHRLCVNFVPCSIKVGTVVHPPEIKTLTALRWPFFQIIWPKFRMLGNCPCYSDRCLGRCCLTPQTATPDLGSLPIKKRIT